MSDEQFNREMDEIAAWVKSIPGDAEIRAAERERCAKIAEAQYADGGWHTYFKTAAGVIADAIRNADGPSTHPSEPTTS